MYITAVMDRLQLGKSSPLRSELPKVIRILKRLNDLGTFTDDLSKDVLNCLKNLRINLENSEEILNELEKKFQSNLNTLGKSGAVWRGEDGIVDAVDEMKSIFDELRDIITDPDNSAEIKIVEIENKITESIEKLDNALFGGVRAYERILSNADDEINTIVKKTALAKTLKACLIKSLKNKSGKSNEIEELKKKPLSELYFLFEGTEIDIDSIVFLKKEVQIFEGNSADNEIPILKIWKQKFLAIFNKKKYIYKKIKEDVAKHWRCLDKLSEYCKKNNEKNYRMSDIELLEELIEQTDKNGEASQINKAARQIKNLLKIEELSKDDYLLNRYLNNQQLEVDKVPIYIIDIDNNSEGEKAELKKENEETKARIKEINDETIKKFLEKAEKDESSLKYVPYFLLGSIEPDFNFRGTKPDTHHVHTTDEKHKAYVSSVKDQLSITFAKALNSARKKDIRNAFRTFGIFCHLSLDALVRGKQDIKDTISEIRDRKAEDIHEEQDKELEKQIKELFTSNYLLSNSPESIQFEPLVSIDILQETFGCFDIDKSNPPITLKLLNDCLDPIRVAILCLSALGAWLLNELGDLAGIHKKDLLDFDSIYVRRDSDRYKEEFRTLVAGNPKNHPNISCRLAEIFEDEEREDEALNLYNAIHDDNSVYGCLASFRVSHIYHERFQKTKETNDLFSALTISPRLLAS